MGGLEGALEETITTGDAESNSSSWVEKWAEEFACEATKMKCKKNESCVRHLPRDSE